MNNGLHLWHGPNRYRLAAGNVAYVPGAGTVAGGAVGGVLGGVFGGAAELGVAGASAASIPGSLSLDQANRAQADTWFDLLRARQTDPPAGVRVRPPWPNWAWWLGIFGFVLVLVAVITGITFATS